VSGSRKGRRRVEEPQRPPPAEEPQRPPPCGGAAEAAVVWKSRKGRRRVEEPQRPPPCGGAAEAARAGEVGVDVELRVLHFDLERRRVDVRAELQRHFDFTWIARTTAVLVGNLNARDREPSAKGERDRKPKKGRCVSTRRPLRLAGASSPAAMPSSSSTSTTSGTWLATPATSTSISAITSAV
jgi:hypothetical protein